jgi:type I restriction enzyme R subunit
LPNWDLAKAMRDARIREEALGLRDDEVAFYDAIVQNDAAVIELGNESHKLREVLQFKVIHRFGFAT